MAPTEILAIQHFNSIRNLLESTDMKVEMLVGSLKKKKKRIFMKDLKMEK